MCRYAACSVPAAACKTSAANPPFLQAFEVKGLLEVLEGRGSRGSGPGVSTRSWSVCVFELASPWKARNARGPLQMLVLLQLLQ